MLCGRQNNIDTVRRSCRTFNTINSGVHSLRTDLCWVDSYRWVMHVLSYRSPIMPAEQVIAVCTACYICAVVWYINMVTNIKVTHTGQSPKIGVPDWCTGAEISEMRKGGVLKSAPGNQSNAAI